MLAKLSFVVLSLGVIACSLLALRQSRLQVASELTRAQLRINADDEQLWTLRAKIAERIAPSQIERMAQGLGPLQPVTEAPSPTQVAETQPQGLPQPQPPPQRASPPRPIRREARR